MYLSYLSAFKSKNLFAASKFVFVSFFNLSNALLASLVTPTKSVIWFTSLPTKLPKVCSPGIALNTAFLTASKFATIKPKPTASAPIPVAIIAPLKVENAVTTCVLITAPNCLKLSILSPIACSPCDAAIADCTFNKVFCTSSLSLPNKAILPCKAENPPATPAKDEVNALNFASGLKASVNAFASPIRSFNSPATFAALIASLLVEPNLSLST